MLTEPEDGVREPIYGTGAADYQQSEWLAERLEYAWRFDHAEKVWHHFDGVRWAADKTGQVQRVVSTEAALHLLGVEEATKLYGEKVANQMFGGRYIEKVTSEGRRKALQKLEDLAPVSRALEALSTLPGYGTDGSDWDINPFLLGCANGIVDLRKNALVPATPDQLVTRSTGVDFRPISGPEKFAKVAPRFIDFLAQVTSDYDWSEDAEMVAFMLLWFGAGLFGVQPEQRFLLLTGSGRNGKGALKHAILSAIGPEYGMQPDANLYSRSKMGPARSNEARADLMALRGKRIAFFSEPDKGQFNEEMLKAHTGGDTITARGLYQKTPISWEPTHSITFLVNDAPSLEDIGPSMGSRVMVADFRHRFEGSAEDKRLYPSLAAEKEGILSILVWAAKAWYESWERGDGGIILPQRVVEQSKAFIERNDPVAEFLRVNCSVEPGATVSGQLLYDAYQQWHVRGGADGEPMSLVKFSNALEKKGMRRYRVATSRGWTGVRLLNASEAVEADEDEA